ncbi:WD40 repeat-like protein [Guyanagaster necrorhizus]|uniref:WD40 repeat-like protein n=1 Tax=Guyanagaster necrorhizus TaxID=856835 RepID=A0A9P8APP3_9AGAR|nr:WD40 repeat-like protein [Guyanagaster necrorhizus MCA 3950]KAG7443001.1 WD40 repeat-like protein [Guyanagaster necrorhizus MCA 3950]
MPQHDPEIMFLGRGHSLTDVDNDEVDLTGRRMKSNRETVNFRSSNDISSTINPRISNIQTPLRSKRPSEPVASGSRKHPRSTTTPLPGAEGSKDRPFLLLSDDDDELPAFIKSQSPAKSVVASSSHRQKHTPQPSSSSHHKASRLTKRPTAPAKHLKHVAKSILPSQDDFSSLSPHTPRKSSIRIVVHQKWSDQPSSHRQSNELDNVEDEYVKGTWANQNIWHQIPFKAGGEESAISQPFTNLESASKKLPPCERRLRLTNRPYQPQVVPRAPPNERQYIWDMLNDTGIVFPSQRVSHPHNFVLEGQGPARYSLPHRSITQRWEYAAAGPINKIIQYKGCIAACSATAGGSARETDCTYNKNGALLLWCQDRRITLKTKCEPGEEDEGNGEHTEHYWPWGHNGFKRVLEDKDEKSEGGRIEYEYSNDPHCSARDGWRPKYLYKYFSVNDIAFDAKSQRFASSGEDKNVRFWQFSPDIPGNSCEQIFHYDHTRVTHDIAFNPYSLTPDLAVASSKLCIYTDIFSDSRRHEELSIADRQPGRHSVGAFVWGRGPTANSIFASSEPLSKSIAGVGYHKAWNPYEDPDPIYNFDDAQEAGDAMTINSEGSWLALFTAGEPEKHLRLYDIRNRCNRASKHIFLDQPKAGRPDLEVNCASFSPNDRFLAVSRNDNKTQVYDLRMLDKGVMEEFEHQDECKVTPGNVSFGIVHSEWVTLKSNGRMGLITGGEDGMVRMWDPTVSSNNGTVLVEMNSDIAYFSIGDRLKGEYDLVVGDAQGIISVFDTHAGYFEKIETI